MPLQARDRAFLGRASVPHPIEIVRTRGHRVLDRKGKSYIDFTSGWCVGNFGWAKRDLRARIQRFRGPDYVAPSYLYRPWVELAALLADITPGTLHRAYRATGGTEAVDLALQAAALYTGRQKFASIEGCYHGNSIATLALGSSDLGLIRGWRKLAAPLDRDALPRLERLLSKRDVAGFVMEPVICNLAVLVPEREFMLGAQKLCRKYGTLFILDEVATGFGRTGRLFATEHFGLEPDLFCIAKALTAGLAPMGAMMATPEVADALDGLEAYSTYGWHPRSVEAALATVRYFDRHRTKLLSNIKVQSREIEGRLHRMRFGSPVDIRVKGLAIGIELIKPGRAAEIEELCRKRGLLLTSMPGSLSMFPALDVDTRTVRAALDILEDALVG